MRDTLASKVLTYGLLAVFVIMVAVPLFWMVTTVIKTNKELYEDFSYVPHHPTLEHFVRVTVREKLLTNMRNSFSVSMVTTLITVLVSALSAIFSFTLAWNEFLLALVITMDQSTMTVPIKLSMMVVGDQYIWGQLMAGAVLASIPVGILYFIGQRFVVQGLAAGAVKS